MQRSTDRDEQPGAQDIGQGYPEENQAGTGAGTGAHTEQRSDNEPDNGSDDAPRTSRDGEPGQATGNPRAAGG